jgi:hypothetical protein
VEEHHRERIRLELGSLSRRWENLAGKLADPLQTQKLINPPLLL